MRYIEADGVTLAHIANDEEMKALCGAKPFPWDWFQPIKRSKAVCRSCLTSLRNPRRR